tara:strand:- start:6298 stop:6516 length:219 start_codon:yes stop_codon:yes gene_type:complete
MKTSTTDIGAQGGRVSKCHRIAAPPESVTYAAVQAASHQKLGGFILCARMAAATVSAIRMAMVIGPTPPGSG